MVKENRVTLEGIFVTEYAPNTFTRLPVRENEHVLVWFGSIDRNDFSASTEQAFSDDGGKTWETNWVMTFTQR